MNKEHQSILDLKLPFRNYDARIAFVCFEVPCCVEVHIPVSNVSEGLQTMCVSQRRRVLDTTHKMNTSSLLRRFELKTI